MAKALHSAETRTQPRRHEIMRGVTMIELLIVMVVLGILAAVAIPSYTSYTVRGKRAAAKSALLDAASTLERNRTMFGCYNKATMAACQSQAAGNDFALSASMAPPPPQPGSYTLTLAATPTTFSVVATPCGAAGTCAASNDTNFSDADCGIFGMTDSGVRSVTGSAPVATCWDR